MAKADNIFTVSGTAYWTQLHEPNQYDKYQISVALDDEEGFIANYLKEFRVESNFQKNKEGGFSLTDDGKKLFAFRKSATNAKGEPLKKPQLVDANAKPIPPSVLIGNGSKVNVTFAVNLRSDKKATKGSYSIMLIGVQVIELVRYEKAGLFQKVEGYTVSEDELNIDTNTAAYA